MIDKYFHPVASLFPLMGHDAHAALVLDIREHGLRTPIILDPASGLVIDGRNRLMACEELGVEPRYENWDGVGSMTAFVLSLNLTRRHLTDSQRAMVAAKARDQFAEEAAARQVATQIKAKTNKLKVDQNSPDETQVLSNEVGSNLSQPAETGRSTEKAAEILHVSRTLVESAAKVLRDGSPAMVSAIESGAIPATTAAKLTGLPPEEQAEIASKGKKAAAAAAKTARQRKAAPAAEDVAAAAAKRRMVDILTQAGKLIHGFGELDFARLTSNMNRAEIDKWSTVASELARLLEEFNSELIEAYSAHC